MLSRLLSTAPVPAPGGWERRVRAVIEAAVPTDATPEHVEQTVRRAAAYAASLPPPARLLLGALLWHLEICPPEVIGRLSWFRRLCRHDRTRVLTAWEASRSYARRAGAQALKGLTLSFYYSLPQVRASLLSGRGSR